MKKILVIVIVNLLVSLSTNAFSQSTVPLQTTEVVVAFGELQHAGLVLNQVSICSVPGLASSCNPVLSNNNYLNIMNGVSKFNSELAKLPDAWKITANTSIDEIVMGLDDAGKKIMKAYIAMVRSIIKG